MGRRYEDVFGELEEVFPLKGERLVELPQALRIIAERTSPVGAEPAAVDEQLLGRVLAEPVTLTGTAQPATILQAGTVLGSLHLGLLAQSGPERVPVRRPVRAFVLAVTAGSEQEAAALLLQLSGELTNWPVEVHSSGVAASQDEALLKAVAEGVTHDICCIASPESALSAVREATRALDCRSLFEGLLCSPVARTMAMKRWDCLVVVLPAGSLPAFLAQKLILGFALACLLGIPPAPPRELPTDRELPMSNHQALLIPATHVRSPAGLAVRPLGDPGQPTEEDFVQATCFIYHPPHALPRERLDLVRVLPVSGRQTGPPLGPSTAEEPTR